MKRPRITEEMEDAFWADEADKALEEAARLGEKPIPFQEVERQLDAEAQERAHSRRRQRTPRKSGGT